jgi:hypothetical protein
MALTSGAPGDGRHQALSRLANLQAKDLPSIVLMMLVVEHVEHYMIMDARGEQA